MVFAGYSGFLHYLQLASHELATIGINVTKKKRNSKFQMYWSVEIVNDCFLFNCILNLYRIEFDLMFQHSCFLIIEVIVVFSQ